jgi:hypothetical protein
LTVAAAAAAAAAELEMEDRFGQTQVAVSTLRKIINETGIPD